MKKQNKVSAETAKTEKKGLTKTTKTKGSDFLPSFVEADRMLERFTDLSREIGSKAFEFFLKRGGEMGREFDDWLRAESEVLHPVSVEVTETQKQYKIQATVTGFKPEEIEISIKDNTLILSGQTQTEEKREGENTVYSERRSNRFFRMIPLSSEVNADKVKATLKDDVLQLTLPKKPETKEKRIAVNAS